MDEDYTLEFEAKRQDSGRYTVTITDITWDEIQMIAAFLTTGVPNEDISLNYTTDDGITHTA